MRQAKQKGMGLLEVLVAMLLIGIGITGSIAMMQTGIRYTDSSITRNIAVFHLENLINQMKANPTVPDVYINSNPASITDVCNVGESYTPTIQAKCDLKQWYDNTRLDIPDAQVTLVRAAADADQFLATVSWNKANESNRALDADLTNSVQIIFSI